MTLEDEHAKEDGGEWKVHENCRERGVKETEDMMSVGGHPVVATFSAEDTPSPQLLSPMGSSTVSDDYSILAASLPAYVPLRIQSQSHETTIVPSILSSMPIALPTPSVPSNVISITTSTTRAIPTSRYEPLPDQPLHEPKTVKSALNLLRSLKPQLDAILGIPIPLTVLESSVDDTAMEVPSTDDADVEPGSNSGSGHDVGIGVGGLQQKRHRKSALTVTMDKMDIMQQVAPPKPTNKRKEKMKEKTMQKVTEVGALAIPPFSTLGSAAVIPISSTHVVPEVDPIPEQAELASSKEEIMRSDPATLVDGADDIWAMGEHHVSVAKGRRGGPQAPPHLR
jgi:hypothetical protein